MTLNFFLGVVVGLQQEDHLASNKLKTLWEKVGYCQSLPNDVTVHLIITSCPDVSHKLRHYNGYRVQLLISLGEDDVPGAKIAHPSLTDNSLSKS